MSDEDHDPVVAADDSEERTDDERTDDDSNDDDSNDDEAIEDEDDAAFQALPNVLLKDDPNRMRITSEERRVALLIKQAVLEHPDIRGVSDFMCAQLAIVDGGDIEESLERLFKWQCVREEYKVSDTVEDCVYSFAKFLKIMPRYHLGFAYHDVGGNYVMIYDNANFDSRVLENEDNVITWMQSSYYHCDVLNPDLEAVRRGVLFMAECEGYDWKKGMSLTLLKRVWSEVAGVYPIRWVKIKYFNAGVTMNLVTSMLKPFIPKDVRQKLEFGCQYEKRLDELYLVPTVEAAHLRFLERIEIAIQKRYENELSFVL